MSRISWGVDGYGVKHYLCAHCELVFGVVDIDQIKHECNEAEVRKYCNRDKVSERNQKQ
jgi:hypothetical protein